MSSASNCAVLCTALSLVAQLVSHSLEWILPPVSLLLGPPPFTQCCLPLMSYADLVVKVRSANPSLLFIQCLITEDSLDFLIFKKLENRYMR